MPNGDEKVQPITFEAVRIKELKFGDDVYYEGENKVGIVIKESTTFLHHHKVIEIEFKWGNLIGEIRKTIRKYISDQEMNEKINRIRWLTDNKRSSQSKNKKN